MIPPRIAPRIAPRISSSSAMTFLAFIGSLLVARVGMASRSSTIIISVLSYSLQEQSLVLTIAEEHVGGPQSNCQKHLAFKMTSLFFSHSIRLHVPVVACAPCPDLVAQPVASCALSMENLNGSQETKRKSSKE